MFPRALLFLIVFFSVNISCAAPEQWRQRSIYQVLTDRYARTDNNHSARCNVTERVYCGGTYRGLINNLDYIEDMGFSAIWISPITHNVEGKTGWGEAYHGYWQEDISRLNSNFGAEDDLKDLSSELHRRGMFLMVDVVVNHFVSPQPANLTNYSRFGPFNNASFFHPYCEITNYDDQSLVEKCWLGDSKVWLADVDTEQAKVISTYKKWITSLVTSYSIDGLRLDTAKHVQKSFWPEFSKSAGVFATGEVFSGNYEYTCNYQRYLDSVINYPIYYPLTRAFSSSTGNVTELVDMHHNLQKGCKDPTLLLTFASNHDVTRLAALSPSLALRKNVLAYTLLSDGIPIIYQGDEHGFSGFSDPDNREAMWLSKFDKSAPLYQMIQKLNKLRTWAGRDDSQYWTSMTSIVWNDDHTLVMRKGSNASQIVVILTNKGRNSTTKIYNTGFGEGTKLVDVLACEQVVVGSGGVLSVEMIDESPKVFFPLRRLLWSSICDQWSSKTGRPRLPKLTMH